MRPVLQSAAVPLQRDAVSKPCTNPASTTNGFQDRCHDGLTRTEIAGLPVRDLVQQFGTPTYVYDAATIVERIESLRSFDVIRYAQKACSNLAILDLMRRQGVMVDAVSAGEIQRALAAGYVAAGESAGNRLHGRYLRPRCAGDGGRARDLQSTSARPT